MSLTDITSWISKNPNKHHLPSFQAKKTNDDVEEFHWDGSPKLLLSLPGSLSCLLTFVDPVFRYASENGQRQILRETILELEERIQKELVGRKWSRRKLCELVSAELAEKKPTMNAALEEALCELYRVQKVLVNHTDKTLSFAPEDLRLWKSDRKIFISDSENMWLYEKQFSSLPNFLTWLQAKEDEKWKVEWPVADGKLEELRGELSAKGLQAHPRIPGEKVKKEDYARALGRAQAISTLSTTREAVEI
jgi:hypothetical protein